MQTRIYMKNKAVTIKLRFTVYWFNRYLGQINITPLCLDSRRLCFTFRSVP